MKPHAGRQKQICELEILLVRIRVEHQHRRRLARLANPDDNCLLPGCLADGKGETVQQTFVGILHEAIKLLDPVVVQHP